MTPTVKNRVIESLCRSDEVSRDARAARIQWLSQFEPKVSGFCAPIEETVLMVEAKSCFVNGLNVATLMLCASFIEHKLFDSLKKKNIVKDSPTFASSINLARENKLFPEDLLDRTDRIRELRNPFAHKKPDGHAHSLGTRFLSQKLHPQTIIEADAALAIESMLEYFSLTLIRVK